MRSLFLLSAIASIALMSSFAQAQVVTWCPASDVATDAGNSSDVYLKGSLVEAFNAVAPDQIAAATAVEVNSVVFTPRTNMFSPNNGVGGTLDFSMGTNGGDSAYDTILSTVNHGGGTDATTITVGAAGGLTAGNNYEIQIWYVDDRSASDRRQTPVSDGNGNVVILNDQFAIGSFTADGPTLELTLESPDFGQAHFNAYQIRDVTNSTGVLLGDVNLDGTVDFSDIAPFIGVLSTPGAYQAEADCDSNGRVGFSDITPFVEALKGRAAPVASDRFSDLEDHINGTDTMTVFELRSWSTDFQQCDADNLGNNVPDFMAAVEVVELYESVVGPLFTSNGQQSFATSWSNDSNVGRGLGRTMLGVYQAVFDGIDARLLAQEPEIVDGVMFRSTENFPGSVPNPLSPNANYTVQIDGTLNAEFGSPGGYNTNAARRMTGAYLAPGTIAEVIVPNELVNAGYEVRVGGHSWDLSNKNNANRLYRVSNTFAITDNLVKVANPMGGNIYIDVPVGADAGVVTVVFRNTIRAPFFSNRSFQKTTQAQWENVERHHPGAFADIESEHSMWTVPSKWVTDLSYNSLMEIIEAHDANIQVASEYAGKNPQRHKAILYMIVDTQLRANAFSTGYPQSNYGTFSQNTIREPLTLGNAFNKVLWHEHGHAELVTMFWGETESLVHMAALSIGMENYGMTLQEAFGASLAYGSTNHTTSHALNSWVVMDEFLIGQNMAFQQGSYRPRGHADYAEYVEMFGLSALQDFNRQINIEMDGLDWDTTNWPHGRTTHNANNRILRLSRAAGVNVAPLFHMWGHAPSNLSDLNTSLANEGLGQSVKIYDRMVLARNSVPLSQAQWNAVDIRMRDFLNEARGPWAELRSNYDVARGQAAVDRIQELIDLYFPNGRP